MTLGSLFNGISGFILAGQRCGIETLWESEVNAFCEAVTKHHFPQVQQLGDITKIDGATIPPVDIICAGSPCQDLSVAGKQEGLKGARSGLFIQAINIVRRMRSATDGKYPRFFVWENVPGAFSSNKGMDFRAVLESITETEIPIPKSGRWANAGMVEWRGGSVAWRILDAQYWGVPQRRKRIFLVADFGGQSAGEILFEREGSNRHFTESGEAGKGFAAGTESGVGSASIVRMRAGCAGGGKGALISREKSLSLLNHNEQVLFTNGCLTPWDSQGNRIISPDGVAQTLRTHESGGNWSGNVIVPDKARSLTARNDGSPCVDRGPEIVSCQTTVGALTACDHKGIGNEYVEQGKCVIQSKTVRRLTPLECERLQGLPDGFTLIDHKTCSDTARYKALGNGMAQPCADYVIRRIKEAIA